MGINSVIAGTFHVEGGFRPCLAKAGYKWSYLLYVKGTKLKCKRLKSQKTGRVRPIVGMKEYDPILLAEAFLSNSRLTGKPRVMSKKAKVILTETLEDK